MNLNNYLNTNRDKSLAMHLIQYLVPPCPFDIA